MPSIAHLVLGGIIGICLYYISNGKFSKTHVFIFFMSNYIGPDVGWVIGLGQFSHSLFFWPIFAVLLTFIYHYFTRFTIQFEGLKNMEIIELEEYKISYLNTYFLVLAAGILHNYLDGIMNRGGIFYLFPLTLSSSPEFEGVTLNITDLMSLWEVGVLEINLFIAGLVGIFFIFGFLFIFIWFLKRSSVKAAIINITFIFAFMVFFFIAGSAATFMHNDAGAILYICMFWVLPLVLCVLSTRNFNFPKTKGKQLLKFRNMEIFNPKRKLLFITLILLIGGILILSISLMGFLFNERILNYVNIYYGDEIPVDFNFSEIIIYMIMGEIMLLVISIINLISAFGLFIKNKKIWKFAIYINLLFSWTLIGLMIACNLSENKIKEIINN